jgi:elongation factor P
MLQATELRKGHIIHYEGGMWMILSVDHVTPGNWRGFVKAKMRNINTGGGAEVRFGSTEKFEQAHVETKEVDYSYFDGSNYVFMDPISYEQIFIHKDKVGEDDAKWLVENMKLTLTLHEGNPMGIELPPSMEAKVVETEPNLRGATVSNVFKPAKLENGVTVTVPPFIEVGEVILVDPREGKYLERAGGKK